MKRIKALSIITGIYILAYVLGALAVIGIDNLVLKLFVFDIVATVVTFVFSVLLKNSSVYDPYWSLTPLVLIVWIYVVNGSFSLMHILFLTAFFLWGIRLTVNWITVFCDFSYEDWRYKMFRDNNGPFMWFLANFFGIHMVPTLVVFAGMLPIFELAKANLGILSVPGILIVLFGTSLELFADKDMHRFLETTKEKVSCREGLWKYSRHPNYLGEISVWVGTFLTVLPYAPDKWLCGIGALSVALLFNFISIPMMEKRQLSRRPDYVQYKKETSRLLLMPPKKVV
ncbi:MAG: DUF1295 domain-containing protein [Lachnospiraceae bacterium]|nr:DUF1295 domain-containing protein [Lachnospiraceae bacterium]